MSRDRKGTIVERDGKIYVRVSYTDGLGKRREQRRRDEFIEWQQARKITLVEAQPGGWKDGVKYKSKYRIAGVFQVAIETDKRARAKPGFEKNPKRELRKAAAVVYLEFQSWEQGQARQNRFRKGRRTTDTFRKLISTYLDDLCGAALIERRDLPQILEDIELDVHQRRLKCSNSAPLPNRVQVQQAQTVTPGAMVDNLSTIKPGMKDAENGVVHTLSEQEYGQGSVAPRPAIGQTVEEFCAENFPPEDFPAELDVDDDQVVTRPSSQRDRGPSERMRELILRAGHIVPSTMDEASRLIGELIAANAFSTFLSLEELRQYDPRGGRGPWKEKRWCCPLCGKSITNDHRDLSANVHTGKYHCHACHTGGILREYLGDSSAPRTFTHTGPKEQQVDEANEQWRRWHTRSEHIRSTPGADYLKRRGVLLQAAENAGVRFGQWFHDGKVSRRQAVRGRYLRCQRRRRQIHCGAGSQLSAII
jgi:hypothetical protein